MLLLVETQHVFRALCSKLGAQALTLTVGNKPTTNNQFPAHASAAVRFVFTHFSLLGSYLETRESV